MKQPFVSSLASLLPILIWGCSEAPEETDKRLTAPAWSDEQEVIHQLREVIRYEDESERQRQADLENLALPIDAMTPAEAAMPAGEGQDQTQH